MAVTGWIARILPLPALVIALALPGVAAARGQTDMRRSGVVSGRVIPAGGGDVRGMRVLVRAGALADSAVVDSAGRFSVALMDSAAADSVDVWVGAADDSTRTFHPARLRLERRDLAREQEIVLVPLKWTIRAGRYAGRQVDVPLARAFTGACAECTGFFRRIGAGGGGGHTRLQGWPAERFPLRVAFDRDWSGVNVTAR